MSDQIKALRERLRSFYPLDPVTADHIAEELHQRGVRPEQITHRLVATLARDYIEELRKFGKRYGYEPSDELKARTDNELSSLEKRLGDKWRT